MLAKSVFQALGRKEEIEYIEMPKHLQKKYQYYTKADMEKLRNVGYDTDFYRLDEGTADYVQNYLERDFLTY